MSRPSVNHSSHDSQITLSPSHPLTPSLHHPTLTPDQFAAMVEPLRAGLIAWAMQRKPCSREDAEDLYGEAVHLALLILPEFDASTGAEGLRKWMTGILRCAILTARQKEARRPKTAPIEAAAEEPAIAPQVPPEKVIAEKLRVLPQHLADVVWLWYAGYSQTQIAREYALLEMHRNTVANRLKAAFAILRENCPREDELTYDTELIDECSHVTIYRKPKCPWRPWRHNHPYEPSVSALARNSEQAEHTFALRIQSLKGGRYTLHWLAA